MRSEPPRVGLVSRVKERDAGRRRALGGGAGIHAENRCVRAFIHDVAIDSSGWCLIASACLRHSRRSLFFEAYWRQRLAAGNRIGECRAHKTHKLLLILGPNWRAAI